MPEGESWLSQTIDKIMADVPDGAWERPRRVSTHEMVRMIDWLMWQSECVSNLRKPESDNCYGKAATALRACLPTDHPLYPRR